jgi:hypothetical protein
LYKFLSNLIISKKYCLKLNNRSNSFNKFYN